MQHDAPTARPASDDAPVLGLVLSSGAARGAAHVGVLRALAEHGIEPDLVVGTSAGALIGGAWASGISPAELSEQVARTTWADIGKVTPNRNLAIIETTALRTNLDWIFRHRTIEELPRRFGAVATDVRLRRPVLLASGDAATAVQASIAVPGVFPPVRDGDRILFDGVLTSPLPVWAAYSLGATHTISVRLRPETPSTRRENLQRLVLPPAESVVADLEILIDTQRYSSWSSRDVASLIDLGHEITCAALADDRNRGFHGACRAAG